MADAQPQNQKTPSREVVGHGPEMTDEQIQDLQRDRREEIQARELEEEVMVAEDTRKLFKGKLLSEEQIEQENRESLERLRAQEGPEAQKNREGIAAAEQAHKEDMEATEQELYGEKTAVADLERVKEALEGGAEAAEEDQGITGTA